MNKTPQLARMLLHVLISVYFDLDIDESRSALYSNNLSKEYELLFWAIEAIINTSPFEIELK